jgi:putative Holliday junction resolvase
VETPLAALLDVLAPGKRLLGVDPGTKRIGIAISDATLTVATPLTTIVRKKFATDSAALLALVRERNVGAIVYGLPRNMDGSEGPRAQSARAFARNFTAHAALPYAFWDERLSTAAVERALISEADLSRERRSAVVDRAAAAYILQGALDALAHHRAAGRGG